MYHLSASLALTSSNYPEGAEYRHLCSSPWDEGFVLHCKSPQYFLWSPLKINWKCSFIFLVFLAILPSFQFCAWRMPALQGFSALFFCLFALCCAVSHTFLHSQPGPGSWCGVWFQKEASSSCCSCERCLGAMLLFTQRFHEDMLVCSAARSAAETALDHIAVQVWVNCCFGCKRGAWLTAVFLTTCLHYFSKIYIELWLAEQSKMTLCN